MPRWVLASSNAGKLRELAQLLAGRGVVLSTQSELGVTSPEEPYATFLENALHKARHASRETGLPALADDSGLVVSALNGGPGVWSSSHDWPWLLHELSLLEQSGQSVDRSAWFACVMVWLRTADDPMPLVAQGIWRGQIATQAKGEGGFGYDPVFVDLTSGRHAAEMTAEEKNAVSHRGQALRRLETLLDQAGLH